MKLTDHDEFLHLGYPRENAFSWKENYYFNFIDKQANAVGIVHFSLRRNKGIVVARVHLVVDGSPFTFISKTPWPSDDPMFQQDAVVLGNKNLHLMVSEPHQTLTVSLDDGKGNTLSLRYTKRFETYLFEHVDTADLADKSLQAEHYEQAMEVEGVLNIQGVEKTINTLGHRDHTWGFRDESGLKGWNWCAAQFPNSSWAFSRVRGKEGVYIGGYVSSAEENIRIAGVEILDVESDENSDPVVTRMKVLLANDKVYHLTATRFQVMPLGERVAGSVFFHENFSHYKIEETGDEGVGVDEHMVILPK